VTYLVYNKITQKVLYFNIYLFVSHILFFFTFKIAHILSLHSKVFHSNKFLKVKDIGGTYGLFEFQFLPALYAFFCPTIFIQ